MSKTIYCVKRSALANLARSKSINNPTLTSLKIGQAFNIGNIRYRVIENISDYKQKWIRVLSANNLYCSENAFKETLLQPEENIIKNENFENYRLVEISVQSEFETFNVNQYNNSLQKNLYEYIRHENIHGQPLLENYEIVIHSANGQYIPPFKDEKIHIVLSGAPFEIPDYYSHSRWNTINPHLENRIRGNLRYYGPNPDLNDYPEFEDKRFGPNREFYKIYNTFYIPQGITEKTIYVHEVIYYLSRVTKICCEQIEYFDLPEKIRKKISQNSIDRMSNNEITQIMSIINAHERSLHDISVLLEEKKQNIKSSQASILIAQEEAKRHESLEKFTAYLDDQVKKILQIEDVDKVWFNEKHNIVIQTKNIILEEPIHNKKYHGGVFHIIFNTEKHNPPDIINTTRMVGKAHHPHAQPAPCWGNVGEMLQSPLKASDYATATCLIIMYLKSVNIEDQWGKTIGYWPKINKSIPRLQEDNYDRERDKKIQFKTIVE